MTRFTLRLALPLLLVAAVMNPAHAGEVRTTLDFPIVPLAEEPPPPVWYGGQVLAVDVSSLALMVGCVAAVDNGACAIPLLGYAFGGPIVHGTHKGVGRALASMGMRIGLPFAGLYAGFAIANCPPRNPDAWLDLCGVGEAAIGMMAGMAAAIAVDSIWAFEDAGETSSSPPPRRSSISLTPTVKLAGQSTTFGFVGRF